MSGHPAVPPVSPVLAAHLTGPSVVDVELLPFGATDLRITELPIAWKPPP